MFASLFNYVCVVCLCVCLVGWLLVSFFACFFSSCRLEPLASTSFLYTKAVPHDSQGLLTGRPSRDPAVMPLPSFRSSMSRANPVGKCMLHFSIYLDDLLSLERKPQFANVLNDLILPTKLQSEILLWMTTPQEVHKALRASECNELLAGAVQPPRALPVPCSALPVNSLCPCPCLALAPAFPLAQSSKGIVQSVY